jgi:hypothetical protein
MPNGLMKFPKFKPSSDMSDEEQASPVKPIEKDEELKVYDGSKTSSSLCTDLSMRDYDYMIEPDMLNFYLPPIRNKGDD